MLRADEQRRRRTFGLFFFTGQRVWPFEHILMLKSERKEVGAERCPLKSRSPESWLSLHLLWTGAAATARSRSSRSPKDRLFTARLVPRDSRRASCCVSLRTLSPSHPSIAPLLPPPVRLSVCHSHCLSLYVCFLFQRSVFLQFHYRRTYGGVAFRLVRGFVYIPLME